MKIFVAYPYRFNEQGYRDALARQFADADVTFLYADERLENNHVLTKIRRMMQEADTCMFDISGNNPNVMLELGIALGHGHPGFVAVRNDEVTNIGADVVGWDQLRYDSFESLAAKLQEYAGRGALPTRQTIPSQEPFDAEYADDARDFFDPLFVRNGLIGNFDLTVQPATYNPDLFPRTLVRDKIRELHATYRTRTNIPDVVPYDTNSSQIDNFSGGVSLLYRHPEWRRCEGARLRTSGLYRIIRVFPEDYNEDGHIRDRDYTLEIVGFIEQTTLFHLLARNVARQVLPSSDAKVIVRFRIDGLLNRRPRPDDPQLNSTYSIGAQNGNDAAFEWTDEYTRDELEDQVVNLARARLEDMFWSFALGPGLIPAIQRRLLGASEPRALPPASP